MDIENSADISSSPAPLGSESVVDRDTDDEAEVDAVVEGPHPMATIGE